MTLPQPATAAELLDMGRALIVQRRFDPGAMVKLLDNIPVSDLSTQARGAVRHARLVAQNMFSRDGSRAAVARFALQRVIVLLEMHVVAAT